MPVTLVSLDRPEVRNAVDGEHAQALHDAFVAFDADPDASVAVLHGARRIVLRGRRSEGRRGRDDADLAAGGSPASISARPNGSTTACIARAAKPRILIKLHKTQLASDRTSCRSALANQVRLVLQTAAYWLMLTVRDAIPKVQELATAEFATLRLRLLKIAARVVETASRIRLAFAAACPEADLIRSLPGALLPLGP